MAIKLRNFIAVVLSAGFVIALTGQTQAATTFVWTVNGGAFGASSGSWNTSTNWNPSGPANGSDNTADFSQAFFEDPSTVTLDGTSTISNLHFGDTKGAGHVWYLNAGSGGPLTLSVSSGTPTITVDNQQVATINVVLAGSAFLKSGVGTLTLGGSSANTLTGDTTVGAGTLILYKSSGPALGGNLILAGSETSIILANNEQLPHTAVVTLSPSTGFSYWKLMGYTQTVAGIADNAQGNTEVAYNSAECASNSTLTLSGSGSYTYSGRLWDHNEQNPPIGTLSLVKSGSGTQTLNGPHIQYTGPTTVSQGRLVLGATVHFTSTITNNATVELAPDGRDWGFSDDIPTYPTFTGTGTVVKTGANIVSFGFNGAGGAYISMGTNGLIDVQAGTLKNLLGHGNWMNNLASLNVASSAVFDLYQNDVWVDALTGAGTVNNGYPNQPQTLTVGAAGHSGTFSGTIQNTGGRLSLVKIGTGTQTLSGNNSYGGGTIVSNGTLLVDNTVGSGTGTGAVIVAGGATLGGTGGVAGPVTINGTLAPGNSPGTLTISNNLVINNGAVLKYDLGANSDRTTVTGNLTLAGTLNVIDAGSFGTGTYILFTYGGTLINNGLNIGTTPNPSLTYTIDTNTSGQVKLNVTGLAPADPYALWQQQYFHCTACPQAAGNADPLGKGMSNTNQFLAGLDPTNSASLFRIISAVSSGNNITLTWQTVGSRTNVVQVTGGQTDGSYTNDFQDIDTVIISGSGNVTTNYVEVGGATNSHVRYYRIRLGP